MPGGKGFSSGGALFGMEVYRSIRARLIFSTDGLGTCFVCVFVCMCVSMFVFACLCLHVCVHVCAGVFNTFFSIVFSPKQRLCNGAGVDVVDILTDPFNVYILCSCVCGGIYLCAGVLTCSRSLVFVSRVPHQRTRCATDGAEIDHAQSGGKGHGGDGLRQGQ